MGMLGDSWIFMGTHEESWGSLGDFGISRDRYCYVLLGFGGMKMGEMLKYYIFIKYFFEIFKNIL